MYYMISLYKLILDSSKVLVFERSSIDRYSQLCL